MKLGIGANAGLASGAVLLVVYTLLRMITTLAIIGGKIFPPFYLFTFLKIITWMFFEGYYGTFLRQSKLFPIVQKSWIINYDFDVIFILVFLISLLLVSSLLGRIFQAVHNRLPTKSYIKKGFVYALIVWFFLGFAALVLPFILKGFPATKDIPVHIPNIVGWLLYGFLLGKFYDAFSKEPDAGIFYMTKKVILRR